MYISIANNLYFSKQQRKMTSVRNQSVLTRTLNQISNSTSTGILSPSVSSPALNETGHDGSSRGGTPNTVTVDESGFTLLSQDAILRILNIHAEAVIRCVELVDSQELYVTST
jgi:hypothetical protein